MSINSFETYPISTPSSFNRPAPIIIAPDRNADNDKDGDDEKLTYVTPDDLPSSPNGNYTTYRQGKMDDSTEDEMARHYTAVEAQHRSADVAGQSVHVASRCKPGGPSETCDVLALRETEDNIVL